MKNNQAIHQIQDQIMASNPKKVIHILNGSCMLDDFKKNGMMRPGSTYIPFNEAMCWGHADEEIFGEAFIKNRVQSLDSTRQLYHQIVMEPLKPLFEEQFDLIALWFGDDMFCQINMLTVLGYLDQIGYKGDLLLCVGTEDQGGFLPEAYEVTLEGSLERYREVVCQQHMPKGELLPVTYQMVKLYLGYMQADSEIGRYITSHLGQPREVLVEDLLRIFPQYGLGDLQYEMLIARINDLMQ